MPEQEGQQVSPADGEGTVGVDEPLLGAGPAEAGETTGQMWTATGRVGIGTGFGQPGHHVFGEDDPVNEEDRVADDADDEPPLLRRHRPLPKVTVLLGALVVAGTGFLGGVLVQKHHGGGTTAGSFAAAFAARAGGSSGSGSTSGFGGASRISGAGGFAAFGGAGGGATIGQVVTTSGNTLYVETESGSVVAVDASSATITKTVDGTAADLQPGSTVTVVGTKEKDGTVQATSVSITAATSAGGGS